MKTTNAYLDTDVRKAVKSMSDKTPVNQTYLKTVEQELCNCFDFVPSEDHEKVYRLARSEEIKAEAFKDMMMTFLDCIDSLVENTNVISSSDSAATVYNNAVRSVKHRFEKLECDLEALENVEAF